jgi:hypothetical protein
MNEPTPKKPTWWCQFCDKEMVFRQSVVEVSGYTTCGQAKCQRKANTAASDYVREQQKKERAASANVEHFTIFRTETPDDADSWDFCPTEEHPAFLKDIDDCAKAYESGVVRDDEDDDNWWYYLIPADEVIEKAMETGMPVARSDNG